jgi:hypothetical protein
MMLKYISKSHEVMKSPFTDGFPLTLKYSYLSPMVKSQKVHFVEVPDLGSARCPRHPVPCFFVSGRRRGVTSRNLPGKIHCWDAVGVRILYGMNGWSCWEYLQETMVVARKYRGSIFRLTKGGMVCHTLWYPMIMIRKR